MSASPVRGRIKNPLGTILYDLTALKEDIAPLREPVPCFQKLDAMADYFIKLIEDVIEECQKEI